jgi:5-methylcytosine-specific restriction protein A
LKSKIIKAFVDFDNGERPDGYRTPRSWYVLNESGKSYPAKAVWSLATNIKLADFNTKDARDGLLNLELSVINTNEAYDYDEFDRDIEKAKSDTPEKRAKRLEKSTKKSEVSYKLTKVYKRNPDVVVEVLIRANGICEYCKQSAPFMRKKDSSPYLEVHHIKQLSLGGEDTVENALALCPNCHREKHYG